MQNNNSKIITWVLVILIAVAAWYFLAHGSDKKSTDSSPTGQTQTKDNAGGSDYQPKSQDSAQSEDQQYIFTSATYGYSIGYKGIDKVEENDGRFLFLAKDQSNVDQIQIVDPVAATTALSLVETVTFGTNQYQKYKDNLASRHTYYFKTGLKNNKAIMISVENDSGIPNYVDLASLKILQ